MKYSLITTMDGNVGLYAEAELVATWDKRERKSSIEAQVKARTTEGDVVEVDTITGPLPPTLKRPRTKKVVEEE